MKLDRVVDDILSAIQEIPILEELTPVEIVKASAIASGLIMKSAGALEIECDDFVIKFIQK